jgi:hypothetical protein
MTNQLSELHARIDARARKRGRYGRHFFSEARKAAATPTQDGQT